MAIPSDILATVKDLCRVAATDGTYDTRFNTLYDRVLDRAAREHDFFAAEETISGVANQSVYDAQASTSRIMAVFWENTQLRHAFSRSLDLIRQDWQSNSAAQDQGSGAPEFYILEKIPPGLDGGTATIGPNTFAIFPTPAANGTIRLYEIAVPSGDAPFFLRPFLTYRVAAEYYDGATEERDRIAGEFWKQLADAWEDLWTGLLP